MSRPRLRRLIGLLAACAALGTATPAIAQARPPAPVVHVLRAARPEVASRASAAARPPATWRASLTACPPAPRAPFLAGAPRFLAHRALLR